jgi:hypothetical protein
MAMRRTDVFALILAPRYSAHADPHDKGTKHFARDTVHGSARLCQERSLFGASD